MQHGRSIRRPILLALSLLSACAAAESTGATSGASPDSSAQLHSQREGRFVPAGAPAAFLVGRFAGYEGDFDYAADESLKALAAQPNDPEVRQQAFLATLLAGRPEAAQIARNEPDNQAALLFLADLDAARGNWEAAEQRYAALPRQGVTQVLQPLLVAWAQFGGGHTDTALATLRPFEDSDRLRAVYTFHAALIADLANRTAEAGRLYHAAQSAFGTTNLDLARALASWQARQGHEAEARQTLSAVADMGEELAIATSALQMDAAKRPVTSASDGIAEAYLAFAALLRQQDSSEFAGVLLRLALDLQPDMTTARLVSAEVLDQSHHTEAALAVLAPVPASDPLAASVDLRRAVLYDRLDNTDEALRILGKLEVSHPDRPEPWTMQGAILRGRHRYAEAVTAYDKAIALAGTPTRATWPLFYERGIAEERSHQWPLAEADFLRALDLSPDEPSVLNYLGYSWTEMGHDLPRARQMIQRAFEQRPNDGAIIDSLGWIMLRQGDVAGAVKSLERAVELQPEDATINGHLGDAYAAAGRKVEAQFQWRRALTLNPEPEDVPKLEAKLHNAEQAQGGGPTTAEKALP
jgi:tetratricopeptide (TPR) repeat protein